MPSGPQCQGHFNSFRFESVSHENIRTSAGARVDISTDNVSLWPSQVESGSRISEIKIKFWRIRRSRERKPRHWHYREPHFFQGEEEVEKWSFLPEVTQSPAAEIRVRLRVFTNSETAPGRANFLLFLGKVKKRSCAPSSQAPFLSFPFVWWLSWCLCNGMGLHLCVVSSVA